jgi:hypothetical protein
VDLLFGLKSHLPPRRAPQVGAHLLLRAAKTAQHLLDLRAL